MNKKIPLAIVAGILVIVGGYFGFKATQTKSSNNSQATPAPTIKPKVNLIDIKDRPYVVLQPLKARNELELTIYTLPKPATEVEVLLEYDRNKGVLDAVLKNFTLSNLPSVNKLFLGSKSTGGHITYHEDVVGGKLYLTFTGGTEPYSLEVPWRYDDTQPRYTQIATQDSKFQLVLDEPYRTSKILVMQSPGLPAPIDGEVIAGPYLVRGDGVLPKINGKLSLHLNDAEPAAKLFIFDGKSWQPVTATVVDRTLTATVPLADTYVVVK